MQTTDDMKKLGLILMMVIFTGCSPVNFAPGRYVDHHRSTKKYSGVGFSYVLDIMPNGTYNYNYRDAANNKEFSVGSWCITPSGSLLLEDSLYKVTRIPLKVTESANNNDSITFQFNSDIEPSFWHLVINNTMYPIEGKPIMIPKDIDFECFYLLGFNKFYEDMNSPNDLVKSEIYYVNDPNTQSFKVELPRYATDYKILFYKRMYETFIVRKNKLIQKKSDFEYRLSN